MTERFTYRRKEKLKSRKLLDVLFASGKVIQQFPVKLFFSVTDADSFTVQIGVGASKRHFKKAVHRNRVKRLLREAVRLHKNELKKSEIDKQVVLFLLYTDKELPSFDLITEKVGTLFQTLAKRLNESA